MTGRVDVNVFVRLVNGELAVYRQESGEKGRWAVGTLVVSGEVMTELRVAASGYVGGVGCPFNALGVPLDGRCPLCGERDESWRSIGGVGVCP